MKEIIGIKESRNVRRDPVNHACLLPGGTKIFSVTMD